MENASKALIMAGSVLIGVLLLTLGVYIFSLYGNYSKNMYSKIEAAKIDQFNTQFLKYYGTTNTVYKDKDDNEKEYNSPILCTAHDIITLANLAKQSNIEHELKQVQNYNKATFYIQISIPKLRQEGLNLESWSNDKALEFIQNNSLHEAYVKDENGNYVYENGHRLTQKETKNYVCTRIEISETTKRVCYMEFEHYQAGISCTCTR